MRGVGYEVADGTRRSPLAELFAKFGTKSDYQAVGREELGVEWVLT